MGVHRYYAVLLCVFAIVPYTYDAYALSRLDLDNIEINIATLRDDLEKFEQDINTQKSIVNNVENRHKSAVEAEKQARALDRELDTWDARVALNDAKDVLRNLEIELRNENQKLQDFINEKNFALSTILDLEDNLLIQTEEFKKRTIIKDMGLTRVIGIEISKMCIIMHQNNIENNCPTYDLLLEGGLDNSKRESGEFMIIDGVTQRGPPLINNDWRLYDFEKDWLIILDPPSGMRERIKMITIENNLGVFFLANDSKLENGIRTYHQHSYVDGCENAVISATHWKQLIGHAMHTLRTGCTYTGLLTQVTEETEKTEFLITDSNAYKYKQWVTDSKEKCKGLCKEY